MIMSGSIAGGATSGGFKVRTIKKSNINYRSQMNEGTGALPGQTQGGNTNFGASSGNKRPTTTETQRMH